MTKKKEPVVITTAEHEAQDLQPVQEVTTFTALVKFDPLAAEINRLKAHHELKINDLNDSLQLEVIHNARMEVKRTRVNVEKIRKELNENALKYQRAVNSKAKEITEQLEPIELHLQAEEDKVEQEKQRIREELERKAQEQLQQRIARIVNLGMIFTDNVYSYGDKHLTALYLKQCTEPEFNAFVIDLEAIKEQERLAEEARKAEEARQAEELRKQQEELQLKQQAFEQEQERIRIENEAKAAELQRQANELEQQRKEIRDGRVRERNKRFNDLGIHYDKNTESYTYIGICMYKTDVESLGEAEFEDVFTKYKQDIKKREAELEAEAEADRKEEEARIKAETERRAKELADKAEADRKAEEARIKAEQERKAAAEKRKAARRPDKQKVEEYISRLAGVTVEDCPVLKTQEYSSLLSTLQAALNKAINEAMAAVKTLENE